MSYWSNNCVVAVFPIITLLASVPELVTVRGLGRWVGVNQIPLWMFWTVPNIKDLLACTKYLCGHFGPDKMSANSNSKLYLSSLGAVTKKEIQIFLKRLIKCPPFLLRYLCEAWLLSYCNRLHTERYMRTYLCSIKSDIRDLQKCKMKSLFSLIIFCFGKQLFFKKDTYINM